MFDTVCHELQSLNRSGVEQRTVISENAVVADPDIAMIDRAAFVCRTERGSDADEGFAPAGSAVVRSRSAAVLEKVVMDIHVAHGARFEPVVGISFDENCRSGRHEAVVMYDNLSGSGEQDAAGAVGSPEVAIVNRYVGIPRGVFDKIVFPECFIERLTQGDNKPLAAFPDNAFNAVPGPPRSGRSYNRPDLIIGFEHPFCRERTPNNSICFRSFETATIRA